MAQRTQIAYWASAHRQIRTLICLGSCVQAQRSPGSARRLAAALAAWLLSIGWSNGLSTLKSSDRTLMGLRRQPVHTRSKTRIRPAVSSTAKTMNPKSPTSATRRCGTPVGPLNTGSYGSSQILASSVTSMSNPCSGRPCICRSTPDSRCGRYFTLGDGAGGCNPRGASRRRSR